MNNLSPKNLRTKVGILLLISSLAFIFSMQCSINIFQSGDSLTDSSVFKTVALYMDEGYMPYKDTFDHKGPLIYLYNWIGMQISYWRGIWVIEFLSLTSTFLIFYKIARLFCNRKFSILTLLIVTVPLNLYFDGGNMSEEYALPYIAAALYIFIDYFLNNIINRKRLIICGLSFGAVCLLRINMIPVWIVFCIAVLIDCLRLKNYKKIGYFISYFLIGIGIICIPILMWLICRGAFVEFINDYFLFNFMYSESSTGLDRWETFLFFLNTPFILAACVATACLCNTSKKYFNYAYGISIIVTLIMISMSGRKYGHYGMILIPLLCYPIAKLAEKAKDDLEKKATWPIIAIVIIFSVSVCPAWIQSIDNTVTNYMQRDMVESESSTISSKVIDYVVNNTTEDDLITVYGNWDIIYAKSRRLSASKYSYQDPIIHIDHNKYDEYFNELNEMRPKLIIVTPQDEYKLEGINQFINENDYELLATFDEMKNGNRKIYRIYGKDCL